MASLETGPTYEGFTRAQITRGLGGSAEDKCKCLGQIAGFGEGAAIHLGYPAEVARCMKDPSRDVKVAALRALASMGSVGASNVDLVATYMQDADLEVKCAAVAALGGISSYSGAYEQEVAELLREQNPEMLGHARLNFPLHPSLANVAETLRDALVVCQGMEAG